MIADVQSRRPVTVSRRRRARDRRPVRTVCPAGPCNGPRKAFPSWPGWCRHAHRHSGDLGELADTAGRWRAGLEGPPSPAARAARHLVRSVPWQPRQRLPAVINTRAAARVTSVNRLIRRHHVLVGPPRVGADWRRERDVAGAAAVAAC